MAIEALKDTAFPDLSDYKIIDTQKLDYIELSNVKVTIKPEIYLENVHSGKIGGVKFHLSKGSRHVSNKQECNMRQLLLNMDLLIVVSIKTKLIITPVYR